MQGNGERVTVGKASTDLNKNVVSSRRGNNKKQQQNPQMGRKLCKEMYKVFLFSRVSPDGLQKA